MRIKFTRKVRYNKTKDYLYITIPKVVQKLLKAGVTYVVELCSLNEEAGNSDEAVFSPTTKPKPAIWRPASSQHKKGGGKQNDKTI